MKQIASNLNNFHPIYSAWYGGDDISRTYGHSVAILGYWYDTEYNEEGIQYWETLGGYDECCITTTGGKYVMTIGNKNYTWGSTLTVA